jgi:hypothetical protein
MFSPQNFNLSDKGFCFPLSMFLFLIIFSSFSFGFDTRCTENGESIRIQMQITSVTLKEIHHQFKANSKKKVKFRDMPKTLV